MVNWLKECREMSNKIREIALANRGKGGGKEVGTTGAGGDKSIQIDIQAEDIVEEFCERMGNVLLVSEELGEKEYGTPEWVLCVDPIDGSFNYKMGTGDFAFSIAVSKTRDAKTLEFGYIMNLVSGDEYWAQKGKGAYKNGEKMESERCGGGRLLVEVVRRRIMSDIRKAAEELLNAKHIRMYGCAALDCCYVAEGKYDKFIYIGHARIMDVLAGKIIAEEAGCKMLGFNNKIGINETTKVELIG